MDNKTNSIVDALAGTGGIMGAIAREALKTPQNTSTKKSSDNDVFDSSKTTKDNEKDSFDYTMLTKEDNENKLKTASKIIYKNVENKAKKLTITEKIAGYIKAQYPILYIDNFDFQVANRIIKEACSDRVVIEFNNAVGQVDFEKRHPKGNSELIDLVAFLNEFKDEGYEYPLIIFLKDIHRQLDDYNVVSLLKYIAERNLYNEEYSATVVIASSNRIIPKELVEYVTVIDIPYPTIDEIKNIIQDFVETHNIEVADAVVHDLAFALKGHNEFQIKQILNLSFYSIGTLGEESKDFILEQKKQLIKKSNLLEIVDVDKDSTFDKIGGLENLKKWLFRKERVFNELENAAAFGVDVPKGALVVGMPGCGKSLAAKTSANLFKIPLVRLDIGRLFGKYVGESEENMRMALKLAEAISPCILWIDEIEKAFSGLGGAGGASDVTTRLFGQFLTWMQEKEDTVFIIATANDISSIPAEFLRKGRFDELFFVDFPNAVERDAIIDIHINKRVNLQEELDIQEIVEATDGYSGADLEAVVKEAIETCYIEGSETLTIEELLRAQKNIKPISEILEKRIKDIREKIEEMDLKPASKNVDYNRNSTKIFIVGIDEEKKKELEGSVNSPEMITGIFANNYIKEQIDLMKSWQRSSGKYFEFTEKYVESDIVLVIGSSVYWKNSSASMSKKLRMYDAGGFIRIANNGYSLQEKNEKKLKRCKWDLKPIILMQSQNNDTHTTDRFNELSSNAVSLHIKYGPKYLDYAVKNWPKEHRKHIGQAEYGEYTYSQEIYDEIDGVDKNEN